MNVTKEDVYERVKKLALVNVTKKRKLGITARSQSRERTASTDGLADELIFRVLASIHLLVNVTKGHMCI